MRMTVNELRDIINRERQEATIESNVEIHKLKLALADAQRPAQGQVSELLLRELVQSENKIAAIKAIRTLTGYGLKEAKDWCEANHCGFKLTPFVP